MATIPQLRDNAARRNAIANYRLQARYMEARAVAAAEVDHDPVRARSMRYLAGMLRHAARREVLG